MKKLFMIGATAMMMSSSVFALGYCNNNNKCIDVQNCVDMGGGKVHILLNGVQSDHYGTCVGTTGYIPGIPPRKQTR